MKYSLRSLWFCYVLAAYCSAGIWLVLMAVPFALLAPLVILDEMEGQPIKAVSSIVVAEGIAAVIFWVARLTVREGWQVLASLRNEPPSFGRPPALPTSSAPVPNPPKD